MVFSDLFFLFVFLPAFGLTYLAATWIDGERRKESDLVGEHTFGNAVLVAFSLIFYAWGEPVYVLLMIGCVVLNYVAGRGIDALQGGKRKAALTAGVAGNIAILGTFKYAGFLAEQWNSLCQGWQIPDRLFGMDLWETPFSGTDLMVSVPKIALPIGISFYTFQSLSYLVDVYRQEAPVQKGFGGLLLYISMFPQLIAGPIVRYNTVAREIGHRRVTADDVSEGIYRFMVGLGKKVILANQLSEISDQFLAGGLGSVTTTGAWTGIVAFTLQIYFDFSGYSDMAIGLGRCLGFHFNENFRHPYCCRTITDFWRRWHISLGSFFRDYVYIPMGGNRRHQAVNILVVWFLTGLWHGASWNFVIWGVYFGLIVTLEKYTVLKVERRVAESSIGHYLLSPLLHLYSLALVVIGWGIFYFDDSARMTAFFERAFGMTGSLHDFVTVAALTDHAWLWVTCVVLCLPIRGWLESWLAKHSVLQLLERVAVSAVLLGLSVALLVGATNNAFIYTRF